MIMLKMKIVNRLLLANFLNEEGKAGGYTLSSLNKMLKILDKIELKDEERLKVNLRIEEGMVKWEQKNLETGEELDLEKEFELSDELKDLISDILKKKEEKKEFKIQEFKPVTEIAEQLGLKLI